MFICLPLSFFGSRTRLRGLRFREHILPNGLAKRAGSALLFALDVYVASACSEPDLSLSEITACRSNGEHRAWCCPYNLVGQSFS